MTFGAKGIGLSISEIKELSGFSQLGLHIMLQKKKHTVTVLQTKKCLVDKRGEWPD